jgi:hypothetical protein
MILPLTSAETTRISAKIIHQVTSGPAQLSPIHTSLAHLPLLPFMPGPDPAHRPSCPCRFLNWLQSGPLIVFMHLTITEYLHYNLLTLKDQMRASSVKKNTTSQRHPSFYIIFFLFILQNITFGMKQFNGY